MPPKPTFTALIQRVREVIRRVTADPQATSDAPSGLLLGPGQYELRNVLSPADLPVWNTRPVTGHVHVALNGADLVETWVLFSSYVPANTDLQGGGVAAVAIRGTLTGNPGPVADFLDGLRPANPGAVVTTWSHTMPPPPVVGHRAPTIPNPGPKIWEQCAPGQVEIVSLPLGGVPGSLLGTVSIMQVSGAAGAAWQACQFQERWSLLPTTTPLTGSQGALLRRSPNGLPQGSVQQLLWNVQFTNL